MKKSSKIDKSKIIIYKDKQELFENIKILLQNKQYFGIDELVIASAGNSIFRAFHHKKVKPSLVYRKWASNQLKDKNFLRDLLTINSQREYDDWHNKLCNSFKGYWENKMKIRDRKFFGPSRKLPNLFMKVIVLLWDKIPKRKQISLIKYLHVPLDSYVLKAIKHIVELPEMQGLTMSSVDTLDKYEKIQSKIRYLAKEASKVNKMEIYPIYLDFLLWNKRALNL